MNYYISVDEITNNIIFENDKYFWTIEKTSDYYLYQYVKSDKKEYYIMHDKKISVLIDYISKER